MKSWAEMTAQEHVMKAFEYNAHYRDKDEFKVVCASGAEIVCKVVRHVGGFYALDMSTGMEFVSPSGDMELGCFAFAAKMVDYLNTH